MATVFRAIDGSLWDQHFDAKALRRLRPMFGAVPGAAALLGRRRERTWLYFEHPNIRPRNGACRQSAIFDGDKPPWRPFGRDRHDGRDCKAWQTELGSTGQRPMPPWLS